MLLEMVVAFNNKDTLNNEAAFYKERLGFYKAAKIEFQKKKLFLEIENCAAPKLKKVGEF